MKRGEPPRRRKGLRRGNPPRRKTSLERGSADLKRSEIRRVSKKREAANRRRREMKNELWPDGVRPRCVVPWCTRLADNIHEPLSRARGGPIDHPDNSEPSCDPHNEEMTHEPPWAYELDLVIHSWDRRTLAEQAADRRAKLADWRARRAA